MNIIASGSSSESTNQKMNITKMELFLVLKNEDLLGQPPLQCKERLVNYILDKFCVYKQSENSVNRIKYLLKPFVSKTLQRWKKSNWKEERFIKANSTWLKNDFSLPEVSSKSVYTPVTKSTPKVQKRGRPTKTFGESSKRTQRRIVKPIITEASSELLCSAARASLTRSGKRTAARVVNLALTTSPRRYKRMKTIHDAPASADCITSYTPEEALALIIDCDLTKEAYVRIQEGAKSRGANIYPSYNVIVEAKKQCYPDKLKITETSIEIPLQDLLDFTMKRLAVVQQSVFELHHDFETNSAIEVTYKWGLDGSGGHSIYKQCFANSGIYADTNILLCTIVPLQVSEMSPNGKLIYWQNPKPSSSKYSRIVRLRIEKETKETVKFMYAEVEEEVSRLHPTQVTINDKCYTFIHKAVCTMMDGKTCNVLTETASSQTCNICKVTPRNLNDLELLQTKEFPTSSYKYGISVLHSYLRTFEYLLHIAYRMEIQQWQARGEESKNKLKERKKQIADKFFEEMGLVVDQPKQGGGNSNDGNTARKFFADYTKSATITGLDADLIKRFSNILSVISCGFYVNINNFKSYCLDTAKECIRLYGWYKMSASVHKLLLHGADIIKELPLPVGLFSEDVLESSQKEYKNIRLFHARKTSRIDTNCDIAHWMLIASDPIITSKRKPHKKKPAKPFSKEVLEMLEMPLIENLQISLEVADDEQTHYDDDTL